MKENIIIYQTKKGNVELQANIKEDTIWATQDQIASVFETSKQTVSRHLIRIFNEGELGVDSVVKDYLTTATDGKKYNVKAYNLDAVIAVGYRVNSKKATQFRIWATRILREYLVNGHVLNTRRLNEAPEKLDGLEETLELLKSNIPGKLRGKIKLTVTKNLSN